MVRYLFEKEAGQTLQFTTKAQETGNNNSTDDKHWDKYKHWYIVGGIAVLLVAGLVWVFWDKLFSLNLKEEEDD